MTCSNYQVHGSFSLHCQGTHIFEKYPKSITLQVEFRSSLSGHSHKRMARLFNKNLSFSQNLASIPKQTLYVYIPVPLATPGTEFLDLLVSY